MAQAQQRIVAPVPAPRGLPGPWGKIGIAMIILLVAVAIALGANWIVSRGGENTSAPAVPAVQPPAVQPFDSAQDLRPAQPAPVVAPIKEWPKVEDGVWRYTLNIPSMPYIDDPIFNGKMGDGAWWSPGSTPADPNEVTRREIAKRLVPSITDKDAVGISITRNRDNPSIVLAAVDITRDIQTQNELIIRKEFARADELAKLQRVEIYLGLSMDNGKTWRIVPLSFMRDPGNGRELGIDDVLSTGTSSILITIRPFSSHGYWQREILPW